MLICRVSGSPSYYFRRRIPESIRPFWEKNEVWFSLKTSNRITATARAGMVYGQLESIFEDCRLMTQHEEYLRLLEKVMDDAEQAIQLQDGVLAKTIRKNEIRRFSEVLSTSHFFKSFIHEQSRRMKNLIRDVQDLKNGQIINQGRLAESRETRTDLNEILKKMTDMMSNMAIMSQTNFIPVQSVSNQEDEPTSPLFSEIIIPYIDVKKKDYKNDRDIRVLENTFSMFIEIIGDKYVNEYNGKEAHKFIETMRRLPKHYGKSQHYTPIMDAISAGDFQEKTGKVVDRVSDVTVEKKVILMSGLWDFMVPIEHVQRNIWKGFKFSSEKVRDVEDWSEENLTRLSNLRWTSKTLSRKTYAFITAIAAYSGMRQGEICHLRCEDFVQTEDGWMMYVQEHAPTEVDGKLVAFTPKNEAGERVVPVHPELVKIGLIKHVEHMRSAGKAFIFHDLRPSGKQNLLSPRFQQAFSRHKILAGVTEENVFHSFRHSVSTILRNEDTSIREVWIDAVLGHTGDSGKKSEGIKTYLHKIGTKNLKKTISRIHYPASFEISKLF